MFGLGIGEILVILVIAIVFIGPKKLPGLAKSLGNGMREFQNAMRGINHTIHNQPDPNTQDTPAAQQQVEDRPSFEEQFPDDPPHDQNKPTDEEEVAQEVPHSDDTPKS